MLDSFLGVLGIVVSLALYYIGYRQTIGAKKERIASCNADVEKILVRRLVLDGYVASVEDVARLLEGKARDFRVSVDDVLSESQMLNAVYTRLVESDLIPAGQRQEILRRLVPALSETENRPAETLEPRASFATRTTTVLALLGVIASAGGALVSALPDIANLDTRFPALFETLSISAAISLAVIAGLIVVYRLRLSQEEPSNRASEVEHYVRFEKDVQNALRKVGMHVQPVPAEGPGDFIAERGNRRYLIEVKNWQRRVPHQLVQDLAIRLEERARAVGAEPVIVTRVDIDPAQEADYRARIVTVNGLRELSAK